MVVCAHIIVTVCECDYAPVSGAREVTMVMVAARAVCCKVAGIHTE